MVAGFGSFSSFSSILEYFSPISSCYSCYINVWYFVIFRARSPQNPHEENALDFRSTSGDPIPDPRNVCLRKDFIGKQAWRRRRRRKARFFLHQTRLNHVKPSKRKDHFVTPWSISGFLSAILMLSTCFKSSHPMTSPGYHKGKRSAGFSFIGMWVARKIMIVLNC